MKNQRWAAVHSIFEEMDNLQNKSQGVVIAKKKGVQMMRRGIQVDEIVALRAEIRTKLDFLKADLAESLTEREMYLVLFPIVIYFDEKVQTDILSEGKLDWPPLQQELYSTSKGGEIFYEVLDDILRKPETLPFIYEIFYFCLNDGFKGKHGDNLLKINEYKNKLKAKIPIPKMEAPAVAEKAPSLMRRIRFPLHYYVTTLLLLFGMYLGIYWYVNLY